MSKALYLDHSDSGYHCNGSRECMHGRQLPEQQPISAFERYAAVQNSGLQKRNLAIYVNFPAPEQPNSAEFQHSYQQAVLQEISMLAKVSQHKSPIQHLHFIGHTSLYQPHIMEPIIDRLHKHFTLQNHKLFHYSISVNPYLINWGNVGAMRELGFNSISLELDKDEFCFSQIQTIYEAARTLDFNNVGMVLGLQTNQLDELQQQLEQLLTLAPERIQIGQKPNSLLFAQASQQLTACGYNHQGMGCFALPDDTFIAAREAGLLSCNACGQASSNDFDILGFGVAANSQIGELNYQNCPSTQHYLRAIAQKQLPGAIGHKSCVSFL